MINVNNSVELFRSLIAVILILNICGGQAEPVFNQETKIGRFLLSNLSRINKSNKVIFLFVIVIMVTSLGGALEIFAASILLLYFAIRTTLNKLNALKSCNCYFSKNETVSFLLDACILISALALLFDAAYFNFPSSSRLVTGAFVNTKIVFFLIFSLILVIRVKEFRNDKLNVEFDVNGFFASIDGEIIKFSDLQPKSNLSVVVVFKNNCAACEQLKPIIFRLSRAYESEMSFFFLQSDLPILIDGVGLIDSELLKSLSPQGFPFAFLFLHTENRIVGNIRVGITEIWEMLTPVFTKLN